MTHELETETAVFVLHQYDEDRQITFLLNEERKGFSFNFP